MPASPPPSFFIDRLAIANQHESNPSLLFLLLPCLPFKSLADGARIFVGVGGATAQSSEKFVSCEPPVPPPAAPTTYNIDRSLVGHSVSHLHTHPRPATRYLLPSPPALLLSSLKLSGTPRKQPAAVA